MIIKLDKYTVHSFVNPNLLSVGKDVVLGVSILSAAGVGNFTTVTLMNTNGNTITEVPLTQNTEDFLTASVTVPGQVCHLRPHISSPYPE